MKSKKIISILFIFIFMFALLSFKVVNAASVTLDVPTSVTAGDTITAKVNGKAEQWDLVLKANGTTIVSSNNLTNEGSEIPIDASGTYNTTEAGSVTFTLTGDYSYTDGGSVKTQEVSVTKTVTVNEKKQEEPKQDTPPTTKPTEEKKDITFTTASGTVYTTVDSLNFRSTSDGSVIGSIAKKGTELERTGVTDGKVRVKYNGKEGYVSSNYVTTTKPEASTITETKVTFSNVKETVYANSQVNVRKGYSTSDSIVGSLQKGESVTRVGIGSNGWSKVEYKGTTAYISSSYLTTTKPAENEKSNNTNLKTLVVEGLTLTPTFKSDITSYSIQVGENVQSVEIKAEPEDSKATVTVEGNKAIKEGKNTVTISVSAEDGTLKIYEIAVQKEGKKILGLKSLKIEGTNIYKNFESNIYNYDIDIDNNVEKLQIEAIANDEQATVEILGNEELKEGENTINIIVTSKDGTEKATYQINAKKKALTTIGAMEEKTLDSKIYLYIAVGAIVLIALIIVVSYTIKHRNQDEDEDEYENADDFEYEDEEQVNSDYNNVEDKEQAKIDRMTYNENPRPRKGKHF